MKRVSKILIVILLFAAGIYSVDAAKDTILECKYSIVAVDPSNSSRIVADDTITFYFSYTNGLSRKYKMGNGSIGEMTRNAYEGAKPAKLGNNGLKIHLLDPAVFDMVFDKDTTRACPSALTDIKLSHAFWNGTQEYYDFILGNPNYYPEYFAAGQEHERNLKFVSERIVGACEHDGYEQVTEGEDTVCKITCQPGYHVAKANEGCVPCTGNTYNEYQTRVPEGYTLACNQCPSNTPYANSEHTGCVSKTQSSSSRSGSSYGTGSSTSNGSSYNTGTSSKSSSSSNSSNRKLCGSPVVIQIHGRGLASDTWADSLLVQYYTEPKNGNKKFIEISLIRGDWQGTAHAFQLNEPTGNFTDIDYFVKNYGGSIVRVETFGDCDKVGDVISCLFDASRGSGVYIGTKCDEDLGGDPETEQPGQPVSSYHSAYNSKYPSSSSSNNSFKIPDIGGGDGFGKSANCKKIFGENGYNIVNGLIKIVRILAPIVATLVAMITLIPAITAKDEDKVKAATKKCVTIGIVLLVIEVIPYIVRLIGVIIGYDLSCIG